MSRNVLVTGGSGALGRDIVRCFCRQGDAVAFTFNRNRAAAEELARETGAKAFQADLTDGAQVRALVDQVLADLGHLDVLVNNAGATQIMPFALIEEEDWDSVLSACLKSMFLVTRAVVRNMIGRRSGAIVNIGSLAGHRLLEVPVHYATAKAGVSGFTLALAKELSRYGIRVNSVVPGLLEDGVGRMVPDREREEYLHYCATGRPGKMAEVADVVFYLSGENASYVNAQNVFVDGGI